MKRKVLAIVQHRKGRSPGQRFRFENYMEHLENNNYEIKYSYIIDEKDDFYFYSKGYYWKKFFILIKTFFYRINDVRNAKNFDLIFIYREAFMLGTVFFEKRLQKTKVPIVFDFDDSIWLNDTSEGNKNLAWLKSPKKTSKICALSNLVTVGNEYLAQYARQYNQNVKIVPTTIDLTYHSANDQKELSEQICIGWTGTSTTIKHFELALPVLRKIKEKYGDKVCFRVVANIDSLDYDLSIDLIQWNKNTEIADLLAFDIGIMPLPDDEWSKGKCGFKGLQCMALKTPVILSPVGVNTEIVEHGENGFLAINDSEWFDYLCQLIDSFDLRKLIGQEGFNTVNEKYSVEVWKEKVLKNFNDLLLSKE